MDTVEAVVARHMAALQGKRHTMTIKIQGDTLPTFVGCEQSIIDDDNDDDDDDDDDNNAKKGADNILDTSIRKLITSTTSGTQRR